MKWFLNMKIGAKLILGFLLVAILTCAMGIFAVINIQALDKADTELYENYLVPTGQMAKISESFQRQRVNIRQAILVEDKALIDAEIKKIQERRSEIDALATEFESTIETDEMRALFAEFKNTKEVYRPLLDQAIQHIQVGQKQEAVALISETGEGGIASRAEQDAINKIVEAKTRLGGVKAEANEVLANSVSMITIIVLAVVVILSIVLGLLISRIISKPIKATADCAREIAGGNLDAPLTVKSKDEAGQLAATIDGEVRQAFKAIEKARVVSDKQAKYQSEQVGKLLDNIKRLSTGELFCDMTVSSADDDTQSIFETFTEISENLHFSIKTIGEYVQELTSFMGKLAQGDLTEEITSDYLGDFAALKESGNIIINNMNDLFGEIAIAADQVAAGTKQISDGSQEMSQGATEQASSVEELTASVTQIAAQTKQNASNANTANELALTAKDKAEAGNAQMKDMQTAMTEINESSENISKIIKVIDDIAFQTNILALNAAVEAARAGVHGKGFAVVAEEVRNLAARSANAAKETTALIEGSIKKVVAGTNIVDMTATALGSIVESVEKAVDLVGQIALASNEQASGIAQVDDGLSQVSQVVQANSAIAEESAAASEELSSQAEVLKNMIAQFKLKNNLNGVNTAKKADVEMKTQSSKERKSKSMNESEFGKY